MARLFDTITFDCYGTLVDWEAGIGLAFLQASANYDVEIDPDRILASYARHEPVVEAEGYRSYREVMAESARRAAADFNWTLSLDEAQFLPNSLHKWPVFSDTVPALRQLAKAGYKLGILSNVDPDLLAETRRQLQVEFHLVVTAADVRSYKPAHGHFLEARKQLGTRRWLHAAQSYFHDVVPCLALGIPIAWVNRKDQAIPIDEAYPTFKTSTLTELAEVFC